MIGGVDRPPCGLSISFTRSRGMESHTVYSIGAREQRSAGAWHRGLRGRMTSNGTVKVFCVITRLNIGGSAQHVILVAHHLNGPRWACSLVTGRVDAHEGDMMDLAYVRRVEPVVISTLRNGAGPTADLASLFRLYRLFRRERPAIVDLHLFKARLLGGIAARLAGVPVVVETFHGTQFAGYYRPVASWVLLWIERLLARLMDAVVVVSDEVGRELIRQKVIHPRKVHVIPLGLELNRFMQTPRGMLQRELGMPESVPLVGLVGRLVPIKGVRYFIAAAARVALALPQARFVVIGDGPERDALERQSRHAGLGDRLIFLGWRRDVEWLYPDLDVVVLSSLNEGTPVSIIEAMAAGRPVVATQVGGIPDLIQDGVTGLLVPPRDSAAIATAVVRLLRDAGERQRLGAAARRAVTPRFTAARMARDMDTLYWRTLEAKVRKRATAFTDPA